MSDASRKNPSIPAWQKSPSTEADSKDHAATNTETSDSTRKTDISQTELLEQAKEFLEEDSVKNASRAEKVSFLKTKGLQDGDIEELLGKDPGADQELKTVHDTTNTIQEKREKPSTDEKSSIPDSFLPASAPQQDEPSNIPPIITYPEFLLKPQKPPPLITISRLVNAAYVLAGASALTWGASKYMVEPMLESLTQARHNLAEGAIEDLETLNAKLEASVSHVPYIASASALKKQNEHGLDEDTDSIDSDPTEMFHRDIATQTSPGLSRTTSITSLKTEGPDSKTISQASQLANLQAQLASLAQSMNATVDKNSSLQETVKSFQTQLDNLESTYNNITQNFSSIGNLYSNPITDNAKGTTKASNPEAAKFKAEIRSLKGAFLSSRNFPTAPRPTTSVAYGAR